jgi:hypothetical protein
MKCMLKNVSKNLFFTYIWRSWQRNLLVESYTNYYLRERGSLKPETYLSALNYPQGCKILFVQEVVLSLERELLLTVSVVLKSASSVLKLVKRLYITLCSNVMGNFISTPQIRCVNYLAKKSFKSIFSLRCTQLKKKKGGH